MEKDNTAGNLRGRVLSMLIRTLEKGELGHLVLREIYEDPVLSSRDLAFINRLYSGTLEKLVYLDFILDVCSNVPVKKMKPVIRNILRMSLYQMEYMDAVPAPVSIDEGVKLTRKKGFASLTGFVNAVLRRADREVSGIELPPYVKVCAPEWLYTLISDQYGNETAEAFFTAVQQTEDGIRIRLCTGKETPESILQSLREDGCTVAVLKGVEDGYAISRFERLTSLKAFRDGKILVQDPSSLMAAQAALSLRPDPELVLDVCAAPGGKCLYIAEKCPQARVIARDISDKKTQKITENARRLGISNLEVQVHDARVSDPLLEGSADLVICDLPCSGLGVISRKPDILYRLKPEDLPSLQDLQREILDASARAVKPGGTLIYSTCTVNKGENEDNARWFVKEHQGFRNIYETQYLPGRDPYDGFYIAGFRLDKD